MDGITKETKQDWKRIRKTNAYRFMSKFEDHVIHIIKAGHKNAHNPEENMYFVVHEDAYMMRNGECNFFTKQEIKDTFDIEVDF